MTALDFLTAFADAYREVFSHVPADTRRAWNTLSHRVLWDPDSVIQKTAQKLGLVVARGEPLRVDAAFVSQHQEEPWRRFPIRVAVEHENNATTFDQEIRSLMAVRAPLKVGITYVDKIRQKSSDQIDRIKDTIRKEFDLAENNIPESDGVEYLFMIGGVADHEFVFHEWTALTFTVTEFRNSDHAREFVSLAELTSRSQNGL